MFFSQYYPLYQWLTGWAGWDRGAQREQRQTNWWASKSRPFKFYPTTPNYHLQGIIGVIRWKWPGLGVRNGWKMNELLNIWNSAQLNCIRCPVRHITSMFFMNFLQKTMSKYLLLENDSLLSNVDNVSLCISLTTCHPRDRTLREEMSAIMSLRPWSHVSTSLPLVSSPATRALIGPGWPARETRDTGQCDVTGEKTQRFSHVGGGRGDRRLCKYVQKIQ